MKYAKNTQNLEVKLTLNEYNFIISFNSVLLIGRFVLAENVFILFSKHV